MIQGWFNALMAGGGAAVQKTFIIPSAFTSLFTNDIWRFEGGTQYYTDYDFDVIPNAITGNTCYVDLNNGSDANSGTELSPFKTMSFAVSQSFNIFYVKGSGTATECAFTVSKNIKILKWGTDPVEFTTKTSALTWTEHATQANVWQATNPLGASTDIEAVMDRTQLDSNGLFKGLTRKATAAEVNSTPGSFSYSTGLDVVNVRLADDRTPDSDVVCFLDQALLVTSNASSDRYLYVEGIDFYGGNKNVSIINTSSGYIRFGFKECNFNHSTSDDASFYVPGKSLGYVRECNNFYNRDDAWDYIHASTVSLCFEWYCKAGQNTWGGTSVNGSTAHQFSNVIRVGGNYQYTAGKPVTDINDTRTLSIGCVAGNSLAADPNDYAYASNGGSGNTVMWLYECQRIGAKGYYNLDGAGSSTMNIFDGDIGNLLTGTNLEDPGSTTNILTEGDVFEP